jgi:hypothetical protein
MKKRRIILILAAVFMIALVLCASITRNAPNYADFTRFKTSADVETYLKRSLQIGKSTETQIRSFLTGLGVDNCLVYSNKSPEIDKSGIRYDKQLSCRTLAPKVNMGGRNVLEAWLNNTFISWFYDLRFEFLGDTLVGIEVQLADLSL